MGTLKQGILGGFSGKVGTVIGSNRNGIGNIRGLVTSHNYANTTAHQDQKGQICPGHEILTSPGWSAAHGF